MEVPKEVVEVLKNAQVKLQDCLDCVYEDRDPPNESDCLAADRTHTLAKLMNNNTVAKLEAIFDFEDMDELMAAPDACGWPVETPGEAGPAQQDWSGQQNVH